MKKNFFMLPCVAVVVIATFVITMFSQTSEYKGNSLLMANVEALSQNEGTKRAQCYQPSYEGDWKFAYQCDSKTNPDTAYPCPKNESSMILGLSDWCTK